MGEIYANNEIMLQWFEMALWSKIIANWLPDVKRQSIVGFAPLYLKLPWYFIVLANGR